MIFDNVNNNIKHKLLSYEESGNDYWITKVKLKNGEMYSNVYITTSFTFGFPDLLSFKKKILSILNGMDIKKITITNPLKSTKVSLSMKVKEY
jgi:hypothetical protein